MCEGTCRISLTIFPHWLCLDEYFLRWQMYQRHKSEISPVCSICRNHLAITLLKAPTQTSSKQQTGFPKHGNGALQGNSGPLSSAVTQLQCRPQAAAVAFTHPELAPGQRRNPMDASLKLGVRSLPFYLDGSLRHYFYQSNTHCFDTNKKAYEFLRLHKIYKKNPRLCPTPPPPPIFATCLTSVAVSPLC